MTDAPYSWETPLTESNTEHARFLLAALQTLRQRIEPILSKISQYLPDLTDHSLEHITNLRSLTDRLIEPNTLSMLEVYCLNVAFLIHDACLSPLLYEKGPDGIRSSKTYRELLSFDLAPRGPRPPTEFIPEYIEAHPDYTKDPIFFLTLRRLHADNAKNILQDFRLSGDRGYEYLISDFELRQVTSSVCGPIAASHHCVLPEVENSLSEQRTFPFIAQLKDASAEVREIRELYLALILRVTDACQLEGRAPLWHRWLQKPSKESILHWDFQEHLAAAFRNEEIIYTVFPNACPISKADSWWMAYDYIKNVAAHELASARVMISAKNYPPLRCRRVGNIENTKAFQQINRTTGWEPVDIKPTIKDPIHVIRTFGGQNLYGCDPAAPIRELIQNGLDASDALEIKRRAIDPDFICPPIEIDVSTIGDETTMRVRDHGQGMTEYVLREVLPDFGKSIWSKFDEKTDAAALIESGLRPRGRYGIGFFSVFMVAEEVRVVTKSYTSEPPRALNFSTRLNRPILTGATEDEIVRLNGSSGTEVSFVLRKDLQSYGFFDIIGKKLNIYDAIKSVDIFSRFVLAICPLVERQIVVKVNGSNKELKSATMKSLSDDWYLFNERVLGGLPEEYGIIKDLKFLFNHLSEIEDEKGNLLGLIAPNTSELGFMVPGIIVDGGLKVQTVPNFFGIAYGQVLKADRTSATSWLNRIGTESKNKFVSYYKSLLGIQKGKMNAKLLNTETRRIKDPLIAEMLYYDRDFLAGLYYKGGTQAFRQGGKNHRYDTWTNKLKSKRKLIFYLPDIEDDIDGRLAKPLIFDHCYATHNLPIFLRPSFIAMEFDEVRGRDTTIASVLCEHFSNAIGRQVYHKYGKFEIGVRNKIRIYCHGIRFSMEEDSQTISPMEKRLEEMMRLQQAEE